MKKLQFFTFHRILLFVFVYVLSGPEFLFREVKNLGVGVSRVSNFFFFLGVTLHSRM